ncbi:triacylglycerol lipase [Lachnoclostridium sp. An14]|uniref:esterase/lipase family protein n=1 Tax=Lachnoclostridium sp. An14 TaxID=1965562 RepID=UPI000B55AD0F|nr:hypothetical protein [Lachnoclostridium sp. An14]OUQ21350.1 triacylglycerol lipase [Lachnoclostridium sp. An14]
MKIGRIVNRLLCFLICLGTANLPVLVSAGLPGAAAAALAAGFLWCNLFPLAANRRLPARRLRICADGCELLGLFLVSVTVSAVGTLALTGILFPERKGLWALNLAVTVAAETALFWNGILRVYITSLQLGVKWRVIGILCGWVPVANLVALCHIISVASRETAFESFRIRRNRERKEEAVCRTKYPILMVHGVFFRDFQYFNYWGRIPKELEENGATIYYGNHQSAASVETSGEELASRIWEIVEETGCGRVNVITHSKGGLDTRYAVSHLGMEPYVASLTTINTPHRGCEFADYLLDTIPAPAKEKVAESYNRALKKLGDEEPDFLAAVGDLTASACEAFNRETPDRPGVYYQSVGSKLNRASGGRFPLNFSHRLVEVFDGPNDGLVAETSFPWGETFQMLTVEGKRGISHGDMIDLNREDIPGFDVREFYVELVKGLKSRGF